MNKKITSLSINHVKNLSNTYAFIWRHGRNGEVSNTMFDLTPASSVRLAKVLKPFACRLDFDEKGISLRYDSLK